MNIVKNKTKEIKISYNKILERHPVAILGVDYKVKIIYRNIKITQLDVENKTIKISLPNKYKKVSNTCVLDIAIDKLYEQIALVEIERSMEKYRVMLGIAPEDFEIKEIDRLAECKDKKITINPKVVMYGRNVIDYIVLHEYCHLKYKTHSKGFYNMIEKYQKDYKEYEEILRDEKI